VRAFPVGWNRSRFHPTGNRSSIQRVAAGISSFREGVRKLTGLFRRDNPLVAIGKLVRFLAWQVPSQLRRWRFLRMRSAEGRFTYIYAVNFWAADQSRSGPAASLENTAQLRAQLPALFEHYRIRRLFDAPCGDFHWMRHLLAAHPIDYVGGDIVRPMIERNSERYADARTRFVPVDITQGPFPPADLWLCRATFCHLSQADIFRALHRFAASDISYMLASCTNPDGFTNTDIVTGDYHRVDLQSSPYALPHELARLADGADEMRLWSRQQVADALRHAQNW
jgi:hypothetical protein